LSGAEQLVIGQVTSRIQVARQFFCCVDARRPRGDCDLCRRRQPLEALHVSVARSRTDAPRLREAGTRTRLSV